MKHLGLIAVAVVLAFPLADVRAQGSPPPAERPRELGARPGDPREAERPPGTPGSEADKPPATTSPEEKPPASTTPPAGGGELPGTGDPTVPGKKPWPEVIYGVGINGMFNIVPFFFLEAFTKGHQSKHYGVYQPAAGIHFVRRKKNMDMTVRVMFGWYDLKDGNWLGRGHEWDETDYTEFHDMNFLWADISWTWYREVAKNFYIGGGAGIGVGWVTGSVYTTPSEHCNAENYSDCRVCKPSTWVCDQGGCERGQPHPLREKEKDVPPVLPAINGHFALRYDFFRHLSMKFDTGIFLPGFWYLQLSLTAMF